MLWRRFLLLFIASYRANGSLIPLLWNNLTEVQAWTHLYRALLHDSQHHTLTDTVPLPVDLAKIRSNDYDEEYLEDTVKTVWLIGAE